MLAPERAVVLTMKMEADSINDLVGYLISFATNIERGEVTKGCSGGYNSGCVYELRENHDQTHDKYYAELLKYLDAKGIVEPVGE